jgi:CheY-like chemotaxis protein
MLMPVMDGWQVLEILRRDGRLAGIPVILTTVGITTREWAVSHGCVGYLSKPIDVAEMLQEVRRCAVT